MCKYRENNKIIFRSIPCCLSICQAQHDFLVSRRIKLVLFTNINDDATCLCKTNVSPIITSTI